MVTPVHDDAGTLRFFVASRGHHADVGGTTPGSMPQDARSLVEETAPAPQVATFVEESVA